VLVAATGGVANIGDDLTTAATVERVADLLPGIELRVLTDLGPPIDLPAPGRWVGVLADDTAQVLDLSGCRALVLPLAGALHKDFSVRSRHSLAMAAAARGVPVVVTGAGLGLLDGVEDAARELLSAASAVAVRDPLSARRIEALTRRPVEVLGDDALGFEPPRSPLDAGADTASWPSRYLVFHVRSAHYATDDREWMAAWATAVDRAAVAASCDVVALAINAQPPDERSLMASLPFERTARWVPIDGTQDLWTARTVMRGAVGSFVSSFHLALFALEAGRPVLFPTPGQYYGYKVAGLQELFGLGHAFADATPPRSGADLTARLDTVAASLDPSVVTGADERIRSFLRRALS
jgi:polysaccharide pyruvyl transferase WcaK-like protein